MKRFLFLVLALMLCCMSGCEEENNIEVKTSIGDYSFPVFHIYASEETNHRSYKYAVDQRTQVVYIIYGNYDTYGRAISPCLKPDGTPMLADDLGLE